MRVRFGDFTLDAGTRQLLRGGDALHLSRKAFDLLVILLERRPAVVDKDSLRDKLWGATSVVDANLNNLASEIRSVLRDDPHHPRFVRTVHRVGYAFCGTASEEPAPAAGERAPKFWLAWQARTMVLTDAATVIGRDPECGVWIDVPGVSRRHAAVRLTQVDGATTSAVIEDLGSTNGTFVEGRRVTRPVTLVDGDAIRVGEEMLTFRTASAAGAPTKRIVRSGKRDRE
jgi:DNA-binding winged helix-turn-helix (wHTH) protein